MTWDYYETGKEITFKKEEKEKEESIEDILSSLSDKERKRVKKTIQAAEPTEYFGQDFTKLGELLDMMKDLKLIKSDKKLTKKVKSMDERNIDIVATATKLRKEYELLYRQIEKMLYPRRKVDGEEDYYERN